MTQPDSPPLSVYSDVKMECSAATVESRTKDKTIKNKKNIAIVPYKAISPSVLPMEEEVEVDVSGPATAASPTVSSPALEVE